MITFTEDSGEELRAAHQFPLSLAQERLWRRQSEDGGLSPLVAHVDFEGPLDAALLERSIREEVRRCEALRTSFRITEGQPVQLVFDETALAGQLSDGAWRGFAFVDLEPMEEEARSRALQGLVAEISQAAALHDEGPLFRATLVRLTGHRHRCLLSVSPLIFDEYSTAIFLKDLQSLYRKMRGESVAAIESPALQLADYSVWQRAGVEGGTFAAGIASNAQRVAGRFQTADAQNGAYGAQHTTGFRKVPFGLRGKWQAPGRAQGNSDGRALLTAVALRMALAGQQPMVVAASVSGRDHPQVAEMVGPLANKLLLRAPASQDLSFASALDDLEREWVLATEDGDAPYESVIEELAAGEVRWPLAYVELPNAGHQPFAPGISCSVQVDPRADEDAIVTMLVRENGEEMEVAFASHVLNEQELEKGLEADLEWAKRWADGGELGMEELQRELAATAGPEPKPQPAHPAAGEITPAQQALIEIWAGIFGTSSVGVHDDFFELGGHSLLAVRMAARIERVFGVEVPLYSILEKPTIAELAALLEEEESAPVENGPHTLVPLQSEGDREPIYWIPGGRAISVMALREVSLLIGGGHPVYGLESRLPQPGEAFLTVPDRAREYVNLIRKRQPRGPYLLAGFCMGGMVAFEMAQQLRRDGHEVGFLGMVQASLPGFPASRAHRKRMKMQRNWYMARTFAEFVAMRTFGGLLGATREQRQQVLDRFAALLTGWVSTSSQLPEETQTTNSHVMYAYRPAVYPGRVHMFLARDCYESVGISAALDPRGRWQDVAQGGGEIYMLPGNHTSILTQPHARNLADAIRNCLMPSNI